jgi:hypothetical protein
MKNNKISDNELIDFYINKNYSILKISKITKIYTEWISKRLKILDIKIRNGNDTSYYENRKKIFYPCVICGNPKTIEYHKSGNFYCSRHISQLDEYGKILPRTKFDKNEIHILGKYVSMDLYNSKNNKVGESLFDLEDLEVLIKYKWQKDKQGYVVTLIKDDETGDKHRLTMHRFLLNPQKYEIIDHINCDKSDNRKENLRIVDKSKNEMNKPLRNDNSCGYRGVYWNKNKNLWIAEMNLNGKKILNKGFKNKEDAILCREESEVKYFGEYRYNDANKN